MSSYLSLSTALERGIRFILKCGVVYTPQQVAQTSAFGGLKLHNTQMELICCFLNYIDNYSPQLTKDLYGSKSERAKYQAPDGQGLLFDDVPFFSGSEQLAILVHTEKVRLFLFRAYSEIIESRGHNEKNIKREIIGADLGNYSTEIVGG